jgi:hypothetical protein
MINTYYPSLKSTPKVFEDAAPIAAEVFIKNAKYCGVLDENNVLDLKKVTANSFIISNPDILSPLPPQGDNANEQKPNNTVLPKNSTVKQLEQMVNSDERKIRLTGGRFALLKHPLNLNAKDIQILKKEIEQLELLVD